MYEACLQKRIRKRKQTSLDEHRKRNINHPKSRRQKHFNLRRTFLDPKRQIHLQDHKNYQLGDNQQKQSYVDRWEVEQSRTHFQNMQLTITHFHQRFYELAILSEPH